MNGGSGSIGNTTGTMYMNYANSKIGASLKVSSTTPTRSNYKFLGWNTNSSGTGTNYSSGQSVTLTADLPLYARWQDNTAPTVSASPSSSKQCGDNFIVDGDQHTANTHIKTTITGTDAESGIKKISVKIRGDHFGQVYSGSVSNQSSWTVDKDIGVNKADKYYIDVTVTNGVGLNVSKTFGPYIVWGWKDRGVSARPNRWYYIKDDGTYLKNTWIMNNTHYYYLNNNGTYKELALDGDEAEYNTDYTETVNGHSYSFRSYGAVIAMKSGDNKGWQQLYHADGSSDWVYSKYLEGYSIYWDYYYNVDVFKVGENWYSFDKKGYMKHDTWIHVNGKHYYARGWGAYYHDQTVNIGGKNYTFNSNAECTNY